MLTIQDPLSECSTRLLQCADCQQPFLIRYETGSSLQFPDLAPADYLCRPCFDRAARTDQFPILLTPTRKKGETAHGV